ncbi:ActS/PrrB/RegB family redox-sensitive histidine kinase [Limoniibacter endophyticus]|nr:ActS/PrrB/RegB family redox-sensitive histidine kinase [Limoniibacter endophyticus]
MQEARTPDPQQSQRLRVNTLIRLRWLAIIGQTAAVLFVAFWLNFPMPVALCLGLIGILAALNLFLIYHYPASHRLTPLTAFALMTFDALQLAALLYLTGGLTNPFSVLLVVPVVISAASLPLRMTITLGIFVIGLTTALSTYHYPLPWQGEPILIPLLYIAGIWVAVVSTIVFTAVYSWRVAQESRLLANALAATEIILQREQHLSALDGLAAAAAHELGTPLATISLVAKEMQRALGEDERYGEDVALLRSQSERCREILKRLTSLSSEGEAHLAHLPLTSMLEEVSAPHRDFGIRIIKREGVIDGPEPVAKRNAGVLYGLGNLVENAVDFASEKVFIRWGWNAQTVRIEISDDGRGFTLDILDRIGEPYMSTREGDEMGGGLGLGLFIAKTLLERSGATLTFGNSLEPGIGAVVSIVWPRHLFVEPEPQGNTPVGTRA